MAIIQRFNYNLVPYYKKNESVRLNQFDKEMTILHFAIWSYQDRVDLTGLSASISGRKPDDTLYFYECEIVSDPETPEGEHDYKVIQVNVKDQMAVIDGKGIAEITISDGEENIAHTSNFYVMVEKCPTDGYEPSETEISIFQDLLDQAQEIAGSLAGIDTRAETAAQNAETAAAQATSAANSAEECRDDVLISVATATAAADSATASATSASNSATSASASATSAEISATSASTSASSAANAATNANNAAQSALTSASDAQAYATSSNESATNASNSADTATVSASQAAGYANQAAASAQQAQQDFTNIYNGLSDEIAQRTTEDAVINARIDNIMNLPEGSTTGDAQLADIAIGYDGTTYDTPGNAVRAQAMRQGSLARQFSSSTAYAVGDYVWYNNTLYKFTAAHTAGAWLGTDAVTVAIGDDIIEAKGHIEDNSEEISLVKSQLSNQVTALQYAVNAISPVSPVWILNRNVDGIGNVSLNNYMAVTDTIPVSEGDLIIRKTPSTVDNKSLIGYLSEFNGSTFIRRSAFNTYDQNYTISDPNTTHIRVAFGRTSSSGVQISQSDVDNYFRFYIYRQAVTYLDGFVNQGAISALGYTSIAQCTKQGYYTFGSSDVLSDLPSGWSGGGLILTYKNGTVIWQRLVSMKYRFIRYGTSVQWRNEVNLVYAKYTAESGENQSDAKLDVYLPRDVENRRTLYQMGHCVDASANANIWRLMFMYRVDTNGTQRKLTMTGEWECALKLDGRSDFSGGIVHGDEVDTDVKVFVDGTLTDITAVNTFCHELKIVRHSNLYDPNDSTTIIAEHGVEYIYTADGLKINQSIKWKVSETLANCFLAMLPIIKAYSKYRYDDVSFNIIENNQTNYSVTIPNAKSVTEYSTDYDCSATMSIPTYPEGLTGGDCALITDNNGLNYNKVYFHVCTGGTSQIGEVWKSTTVFRNR